MHTEEVKKNWCAQPIHPTCTYNVSKRNELTVEKKSADSVYAELIIRFGEWFNHKQLCRVAKYWPNHLYKVYTVHTLVSLFFFYRKSIHISMRLLQISYDFVSLSRCYSIIFYILGSTSWSSTFHLIASPARFVHPFSQLHWWFGTKNTNRKKRTNMNKKENEENNEKMKFTIIFSLSRLPNGFVLLCAVARQLFTTYKIYIYIYIQSESREPGREKCTTVHIFLLFFQLPYPWFT